MLNACTRIVRIDMGCAGVHMQVRVWLRLTTRTRMMMGVEDTDREQERRAWRGRHCSYVCQSGPRLRRLEWCWPIQSHPFLGLHPNRCHRCRR